MITQQQNSESGAAVAIGQLESLSACMDGEAARGELLAQLGSGGELRAEWSLYHCIGDVLRSEELACHTPGFNERFAAKLAAEPHVFAPRAAKAVAARQAELHRARWIKPASLAASMAAVAVVATVAMQQWTTTAGSAGNQVAVQSLVPQVGPLTPVVAPASASPAAQASLPSAYLMAHRQYASQRAALYVQTISHDAGK